MIKKKIENWQLSYMLHSELAKSKISPKTVKDLTEHGANTINATVPGNFELDFVKAGLLDQDLFFGTNIYKAQELEATHLWYFSKFTIENTEEDAFLLFEGIDTAAEIFVDGNLSVQFSLCNAHRRLSAHGADGTLQITDARFHRISVDHCADRTLRNTEVFLF